MVPLFFLWYLDPGRDKVVSPVIRFKNANELARSSAVFVSLDEIQELFDRHVYEFIDKIVCTFCFSLYLLFSFSLQNLKVSFVN